MDEIPGQAPFGLFAWHLLVGQVQLAIIVYFQGCGELPLMACQCMQNGSMFHSRMPDQLHMKSKEECKLLGVMSLCSQKQPGDTDQCILDCMLQICFHIRLLGQKTAGREPSKRCNSIRQYASLVTGKSFTQTLFFMHSCDGLTQTFSSCLLVMSAGMVAGADTGRTARHQSCSGWPAGGGAAGEEGQPGSQPLHGQAQLQDLTRWLSTDIDCVHNLPTLYKAPTFMSAW